MDKSDQRLLDAFHRSVMMTACLSGLVLCSAEGTLFPSAVTPVVAVIAWLFVDSMKVFRLPVIVANILGLVALSASAMEFVAGNIEAKLLSGAHLIVYLTWIVLLLEKTTRQFWWVITLSLLQLAVSAVLTSSPGFGASLIGMLGVLLWTLSVFSLYRVRIRRPDNASDTAAFVPAELQRDRDPVAGKMIFVQNGLQRDPNEPWINVRFRGVVLLSFAVSIALSLIVFTAFPRIWVPNSPFYAEASEGENRGGFVHRTGFTDSVSLGEIGSILKSSGRVLQYSITDIHTGAPVEAAVFAAAMNMNEVRFRGNALGLYSQSKWSRGFRERGYRQGEFESDQFGELVQIEPDFRLEISQDPPVGQFAFAVFPILRAVADSGSGKIVRRTTSSSLIWSPAGNVDPKAPRTFTLECVSVKDKPEATFEDWVLPPGTMRATRAMDEKRKNYAKHIYLTPDLNVMLPQLYALSRRLSTKDGVLLAESERIQNIMQYLTAENGYRYSLTVTRQNMEVDPVEDFLFNTKTGHCEYFASACTLMLQAADIPARLVNGFSGSLVNTVTGKNEVRQHHAHAWVEAFVNDRWETFDPTLESDRQQTMSGVRSDTILTDLQTAFSDLWTGGIHSMTLERQRAFFDPLLTLMNSLTDSIKKQGLLATIKQFISSLLTSPADWFSWQGGVATFLLLLCLTALLKLHPIRRIRQAILGLIRWITKGPASSTSVVRFYARFCSLCKSNGLTFRSAATALENAEQAVVFFSPQLASDALRQMPFRIASAFNQVRFGEMTLSDDQLQSIGKDLDEFTLALQQTPSPASGQ
jgi:protein-glutamine gamma-glutamyltransferase